MNYTPDEMKRIHDAVAALVHDDSEVLGALGKFFASGRSERPVTQPTLATGKMSGPFDTMMPA